MKEIMFILEIIGTVAFAISGAFGAIGAGLDLFGVVFVGCITATGGGIVRDLIIGKTPPYVFSNVYISLVAIAASLAVFIIAYIIHEKFDSFRTRAEHINNLFDAIGLAAFSVTGVQIGLLHELGYNSFMLIILGMLTGVGGGIFRDILINSTPYVFKKHIYALASIAGCTVYLILDHLFDEETLTSVSAMLVVIVIRLLAAKYRWSLPRIQTGDNNK